MRRAATIRCVLATAILAVGRPSGAAEDKSPFRVAFVGPLSGPLAASGEESLAGLRHAATWHAKSKGGIGKKAIEILPFDDKDDPAEAEKFVSAALASKVQGIVAASTGRTVDGVAARARKAKTPILFVGSAGPAPRLGWQDPVVHLGGWPVDQALSIANLLVAPGHSRFPALVVEDTPRGRDLEAAIVRNVGFRRTVAGVARVAPHAGPASDDLARLKAAKADRLVLVGEPDLVDATVAALAAAAWDVPLLTADGMVSTASAAIRDGKAPKGSLFLVGAPLLTFTGAPTPLYQALDEATKGNVGTIYPRTISGYTAGTLLFEGATPTGPKPAKDLEIVAGIRDQRYGEGEAKTPIVDQTGRASLYRYTLWQTTAKGLLPMEPGYLPADDFGALLGLRRKEMYAVEPGTKVVWVTFGDEKSRPPRTIEKELALLHLGTRGYEGNLDEVVREELMARALGKFNKLFLKNEDGTFIPGVSYAISFTATKPEGMKAPELWRRSSRATTRTRAGGPGPARAAARSTRRFSEGRCSSRGRSSRPSPTRTSRTSTTRCRGRASASSTFAPTSCAR